MKGKEEVLFNYGKSFEEGLEAFFLLFKTLNLFVPKEMVYD